MFPGSASSAKLESVDIWKRAVLVRDFVGERSYGVG